MQVSTHAYDAARELFRATLENALNVHRTKNFNRLPPIRVTVVRGRKFDRVETSDGASRSIYCFINRTSGGLLKGNWKKVEDHRERGNIFNGEADILRGCNPYGLDYMVGTNYAW